MARQFIFIGKALIVATALSLAYFTFASAQGQAVNGTKGATGEQVQRCIQERKSASLSNRDLPRAGRQSIRQQYRTCIIQAVMLNNGHRSTDTCVNSGCVIASTDSSVTVVSPNGGETYKNDGSPIIVTWNTRNVSSSLRLDVLRLRAYPDGREYNVAYGVLNDGHAVVFPSSVPVGAYTLEIKSYVHGMLVMDASDSSFKIIDEATPNVSELVKCDFNGSPTEQQCYTATSSDSALSFGCSGIGACVVKVQGLKDTVLPWKSSCGGYANSTLDGKNEYVKFPCNTVIVPGDQ